MKQSWLLLLWSLCLFFLCAQATLLTEIADGGLVNGSADGSSLSLSLSLDEVRDTLVRLEDTIVFSLIERAKYPLNSAMYKDSAGLIESHQGSFIKFFVRQSEKLHAQVGRYESEEENAFFPGHLPRSLMPSQPLMNVLYPAARSVNINDHIWDLYINQLLPLFTRKGDDGNYALTAASDLACLQAISRRIHYGKFVAEVKFLDDSQEYTRLILAKDRDALLKLLTFEAVEQMVKRRVQKKAETFGQDVNLNDQIDGSTNYKVDPSIVARLYDEWVMPLTKVVEVEYLLRRLD